MCFWERVESCQFCTDRLLCSLVPQHHSGHHFINRDWKGIQSPVDAVMAGRIYVGPWSPPPRRNDYRFDQQWGQQQGQQWNQQYGQQWNQQYGQQWGRRRQSRSPFWEPMAAQGMAMGQGFAERGMEMGLRLAERGMEMEERLGRGWDRRWDQDWDQDRRRDGYRRYNNGNYDSRYNQRDDRAYWDFISRSQPLQSVYFFKGGNTNILLVAAFATSSACPMPLDVLPKIIVTTCVSVVYSGIKTVLTIASSLQSFLLVFVKLLCLFIQRFAGHNWKSSSKPA